LKKFSEIGSREGGMMDDAARQGVISWAFKGLLYKGFVGLVLMLSAGRWDWWWGWLYVGIFVGFDAASAVAVLPEHPDLLIERASRQPETRNWDKVLMPAAAGVLPLLSWVIAGLDERLGWYPEVSRGWQITAAGLTILGYGIVVWAMKANPYFSTVMRIQEDRGQTVQTGGPYRFVRHPGYVGSILFTAFTPMLLGSWWGAVPGALGSVLLILRTALEDRDLKQELPGYRAYAHVVKSRLIPGVW
jgi:protein-S-isoprenylcysteine O-methyltransferase Ste14